MTIMIAMLMTMMTMAKPSQDSPPQEAASRLCLFEPRPAGARCALRGEPGQQDEDDNGHDGLQHEGDDGNDGDVQQDKG